MPPPIRSEFATADPNLWIMLTDDGSRTLMDRRLGETYHSGCGALSESLHVYLRNSGVAELLERQESQVHVLEYGFGTGLSFVLTAAKAMCCGASLHYEALDCRFVHFRIIDALDFDSAFDKAIELGRIEPELIVAKQITAQLLTWRNQLANEPLDGIYSLDFGGGVRLKLIVGDARRYQLDVHTVARFNAVYFDAFSPQSNPELWSESILGTAFTALQPGGALVSYCVKGSVRSALEIVGFRVARIAGPPGGKREVLLARKPHCESIGEENEEVQVERIGQSAELSAEKNLAAGQVTPAYEVGTQ